LLLTGAGLQVGRIDANKWAITARGLNGRFANMLLVLIDGRSVYTPLFSGVYWDQQDLLLEDVERIEVIRGPGATLWGANAVNGIINIITKSAQDTQGGLVTVGGGTEEQGFGALRYGTQVGNRAYLRAYAKYFSRDGSSDPSGDATPDDSQMLRGGFRLDWRASDHDSLMVQGGAFDGEADQALTLPSLTAPFSQTTSDGIETFGVHGLARWTHRFSSSSEMALQLYYDRTDRNEILLQEIRDTFDIDFQHRLGSGRSVELIWGLGYRYTHDDIRNRFFVSFDPKSRGNHLASAFLQGDITLVEDRLRLMVGSKFEHNDFTGFEFQPTGRLLWTPHTRHTIWGAVSRAVRTPSRADNDARFNLSVVPPNTPLNPGALPGLVVFEGNSDIGAEKVLAYELGYRFRPLDQLSIDIAAFYNVYHDLRNAAQLMPSLETVPPPAHLVISSVLENTIHGESFGVELAVDWRALNGWRLRAAYTFLRVQLRFDESRSSFVNTLQGTSPAHQVSIRSSIDLLQTLEFDLWIRYVDTLPRLNVTNLQVDSRVADYVTLDVRLAWKPIPSLELSLVGQNLLESRHLEYIPEAFPFPTEVERGVYGKVTWRF
jgi:iron complex outermembrane receptor protein